MALDERKKTILKALIKEYIKTAVPVSSGVLVEKYKIKASPATVRNDLTVLEDENYIFQPHTSAGRVPTEKAYSLYLAEIKPVTLKDEERKAIKELVKNLKGEEENDEAVLKQVAKLLAKLSDNAVFWAFSKHNLYYTGVYNLLHQPEFKQENLIYNISAIIDRLDDIVSEIFDRERDGLKVEVGTTSHFGDFCSTILLKYRRSSHPSMFGILGPLRMDYEKNIALAEYIKKCLEEK
ncbi:MAG: hypothetical protein MUF50_00500 [Planctomycetes bacterium]|jgi:heat-inducible transcriptional repressor|nr:hypothetical protein [Planctomycetota bacterium]